MWYRGWSIFSSFQPLCNASPCQIYRYRGSFISEWFFKSNLLFQILIKTKSLSPHIPGCFYHTECCRRSSQSLCMVGDFYTPVIQELQRKYLGYDTEPPLFLYIHFDIMQTFLNWYLLLVEPSITVSWRLSQTYHCTCIVVVVFSLLLQWYVCDSLHIRSSNLKNLEHCLEVSKIRTAKFLGLALLSGATYEVTHSNISGLDTCMLQMHWLTKCCLNHENRAGQTCSKDHLYINTTCL